MNSSESLWDVFISHASEDKDQIARPLAKALTDKGLKVWTVELQSKSNKEQKLILESIEYLRNNGLVDSKALATVSITHKGIKEMESIILGTSEHTISSPPHIDKSLTNENEIKSIQNKRTKGDGYQPQGLLYVLWAHKPRSTKRTIPITKLWMFYSETN